MRSELETPRRVLLMSYRRYLEADRDWVLATRAVRAWFPAEDAPPRRPIGDPGSRLRRLFERRARALQQLQVARQELEEARRRFPADRHPSGQVRIRLLTVSRG